MTFVGAMLKRRLLLPLVLIFIATAGMTPSLAELIHHTHSASPKCRVQATQAVDGCAEAVPLSALNVQFPRFFTDTCNVCGASGIARQNGQTWNGAALRIVLAARNYAGIDYPVGPDITKIPGGAYRDISQTALNSDPGCPKTTGGASLCVFSAGTPTVPASLTINSGGAAVSPPTVVINGYDLTNVAIKLHSYIGTVTFSNDLIAMARNGNALPGSRWTTAPGDLTIVKFYNDDFEGNLGCGGCGTETPAPTTSGFNNKTWIWVTPTNGSNGSMAVGSIIDIQRSIFRGIPAVMFLFGNNTSEGQVFALRMKYNYIEDIGAVTAFSHANHGEFVQWSPKPNHVLDPLFIDEGYNVYLQTAKVNGNVAFGGAPGTGGLGPDVIGATDTTVMTNWGHTGNPSFQQTNSNNLFVINNNQYGKGTAATVIDQVAKYGDVYHGENNFSSPSGKEAAGDFCWRLNSGGGTWNSKITTGSLNLITGVACHAPNGTPRRLIERQTKSP